MKGIIEVVWRRRWLALAAAVLTLAAAAGIGLRATPAYSYSSTILLLPPEISRVQDPGTVDYTRGNPLFYLGSLNQTRDILIGALEARDVQAQLATTYPNVSFAVEPDVLSATPVVVITGTGPSDAEARDAVAKLTDQVPATLQRMQVGLGIKDNAQITSHPVLVDKVPEVSHKGQIREAVMASAGLALAFLLLIGAVDGILRSRANARRTAAGEDDADELVDQGGVGEPIALRIETGSQVKASSTRRLADSRARRDR